MNITFHGAWPALITPSTPDGGVDETNLCELVEYLISKEVDGLYLCGSTGEGVQLSVLERKLVVERVIAQVRSRLPVIVHVGGAATRDSVLLARHAREVGADGVSSILPTVTSGMEETYLHYECIAGAVPDLPFFPYLFGGRVNALSLMQQLLQRIPNVAGAKYTGPDMFELWRVIALHTEGWTIFSGMDEQCLFAAMAGAPGNIGSTLNVMPGVYRRIRHCYTVGDIAGALAYQHQANRITSVLIDYGFSGALREAMRMLGIDCGQPRLPHRSLAPEKCDALHADLYQAGFAQVTSL
jgi:N-acetylneuraminate lyase